MSWVKREDRVVKRVTGLRAQTLGFEQEKEGVSELVFLNHSTVSDLLV